MIAKYKWVLAVMATAALMAAASGAIVDAQAPEAQEDTTDKRLADLEKRLKDLETNLEKFKQAQTIQIQELENQVTSVSGRADDLGGRVDNLHDRVQEDGALLSKLYDIVKECCKTPEQNSVSPPPLRQE